MKQIEIDALNLMASSPEHLVSYSEHAYHDQIRKIAEDIKRLPPRERLLLISGPSASGKTWSARLIAKQLEKLGVLPLRISLDRFYKNRADEPTLPNGNKDLESVQAMDSDTLSNCIDELTRRRRTKIPHFDFVTGTRDRWDKVYWEEDGCIILEGIHALNPALLANEFSEPAQKIYISVDTNYVDRNGQVLSFSDIRLLRRMLRDQKHRGSLPIETLAYWPEVIQSERKYITPYLYRAQYRLDSSHQYEPLLYHSILHTLFSQSNAIPEAYREQIEPLKTALQKFQMIDPALVPSDSLLTEFIQ